MTFKKMEPVMKTSGGENLGPGHLLDRTHEGQKVQIGGKTVLNSVMIAALEDKAEEEKENRMTEGKIGKGEEEEVAEGDGVMMTIVHKMTKHQFLLIINMLAELLVISFNDFF